MNFEQLSARIAAIAHRKDLTAQIPGFIEDARTQINDRLGLALVPFTAPGDTDIILVNQHLLYVYPALKALYEYVVEFETAAYYDSLFQRQADAYYITTLFSTPLVIKPENPAP